MREWVIQSKSVPGKSYIVRLDHGGKLSCECLGFVYRNRCRHIAEVIEKANFNDRKEGAMDETIRGTFGAEVLPPSSSGEVLAQNVARSQEVVRPQDGAEWTIEQIVSAMRKIKDLLKEVMVEGEHYGRLTESAKKPTLYKSGAEKLAQLFRLAPVCKEIVERDLPGGHREYRVRLALVHIPTGVEWGDSVGLCTTMESKYRFREAKRSCPLCGAEAIIWSKFEPVGWVCFHKLGGCGARFAETDPRITDQRVGRVENENPADLFNTALKMAYKRAFVSAVILATGASDIFIPDVDEGDEIEEPVPAPSAQRVGGQSPQAMLQRSRSSQPSPNATSAARTNSHEPVRDPVREKIIRFQVEPLRRGLGDEEFFHVLEEEFGVSSLDELSTEIIEQQLVPVILQRVRAKYAR